MIMTERSVFRLLARIVGWVFVGFGLSDGLGGVLAVFGLPSGHYYTALDRVGAAMAYVVTGLLMIALANAVTRLLYGRLETPS
jgi:hypothetical protein